MAENDNLNSVYQFPAIPSGWELYLPIITGLVRQGLVALGMFGVTWAETVTGDQVQFYVGGLMVVAGFIWTAWQKIAGIRAARLLAVQSAIASANATGNTGVNTPVVPNTVELTKKLI